MALVPAAHGPVFAEVDMGVDSSAPTVVRATVVQASTVFYDTPATLDKAERLLAEAAGYGAQLVVFPEAFVGGYPRGSNFGVTIGNRTAKGKEEFRKYHASAIDVPGPEVDRLAAMAGKYKVYLVMGVIERDGYTLYCTVLFFDSQGRYLGKHRKVMPTALERIIWGFGDGSTIPVFETPIGKLGAAICWENRMPLLRTAMYAKGVEIYCAPTADSREIWQASMTHIALEGGCFVLSANQFCLWDNLVEEALVKLENLKLLRSLRPIHLPNDQQSKPIENEAQSSSMSDHEEAGKDLFRVYDEMQQWDRSSVEVQIAEETFQRWVCDIPSTGDEAVCRDKITGNEAEFCPQQFKKLLLFSGNDYLGLSSHPTIGKAAAKAALELGMGPRGSALICGYTNCHRLLESCLADLKMKEDCLLCPTGFAANMAVMVALGNIGALLTARRTPLEEERIAIFSDSLNHASIIDGIRLAERQKSVELFIYRHCDMSHLNALLLNCKTKRKVVVTDGLFSMDGDFAPMIELVKLRRKHQFLLVVDDAHGTFVCGKNGGGVAEEFNCEGDVDICIGTLSKAAGCHGGFIACSKRWKQLIQSRGRSFIFSTAMPVPIAAAAHAAVIVAKKETWRRREIWKRVQDFHALTGIPITSPIISLIVGSEEKALQSSRHLLRSGFHVTAIRPPTVPPNSCRLRVTLTAVHTMDDLKKLTTALSQCIDFQDIGIQNSSGYARL